MWLIALRRGSSRDRPASTCWPPPRVRFARSARMMSIWRVHHPPVERDVVLLLLEPRGSQPRARRRQLGEIRQRRRARRRRARRRCPRRSGARTTSAACASKLPSATCALRRSMRSARRMSIRPCRTRRRREIASSPSSMLREQGRQLGVGERQQVGERFHGCLSVRELGARSCSVAKGSTSA